MKKIFFLVGLLASLSSQAIQFEIRGTKDLGTGSVVADLNKNVGFHSVEILKALGLRFSGDETGILSIENLEQKHEIIDEKTVYFYGWCFSIDGIMPDKMANEVFFESQNQKLVWFYGYAIYFNGQWTEYCRPVTR